MSRQPHLPGRSPSEEQSKNKKKKKQAVEEDRPEKRKEKKEKKKGKRASSRSPSPQLQKKETAGATAGQKNVKTKDASLRDAIANVEGGETVAYNSAICASVGPGGSGKTSTRLAIQDIELTAERNSTVGGDRSMLEFVNVRRGEMVRHSGWSPPRVRKQRVG